MPSPLAASAPYTRLGTGRKIGQMAGNWIEKRRIFAEQRLAELTQQVQEISILKELDNLCIYVTGSFGRLEASEFSDLDLFFIHRGQEQSNALPKKTKTLWTKN